MTRLATPEGTAAFAARHPAAEGHYREAFGLTLSSVGFGSYLGPAHAAADADYEAAFVLGLQEGVNVLDTASVYRAQLSERMVGRALRASGVPREEVLVVTKGGFLPHDADSGLDPQTFLQRTYLDTGILAHGDARGQQAMTPRFLAHELGRSLANLGLDAVDLYLLHNPEAQLLDGLSREDFMHRLEHAFRFLEAARREGRLGAYGLATWPGFRVSPGERGHLPLEDILQLAERVGGPEHGFRAIELPYNMTMPEAAVAPTQPWKGKRVPTLTAARDAELLVLGSASLMQTRVLGRVPESARKALHAEDDAQAAIQFSRTTPGMTIALVGTGRPEHARANAALRHVPAPYGLATRGQ